MILIFGGAYQGKHEFARRQFGEAARIRDDLNRLVWDCCTEDPAQRREAADLLRQTRDQWAGAEEGNAVPAEPGGTKIATLEGPDGSEKRRAAPGGPAGGTPPPQIFIIDDISQGIVPVDERTRAVREMNGRLMTYLASEAEAVYRVFCGIGKRIK